MKLTDTYFISDAVRDGVLVDVCHLREESRFPYPVYMTSAFFGSNEIRGSQLCVVGVLQTIRSWLADEVAAGNFGTKIHNVMPKSWMCAWGVSMRVSILPSQQYGAVVFIAEREGESIDFDMPRTSAGGSFYIV